MEINLPGERDSVTKARGISMKLVIGFRYFHLVVQGHWCWCRKVKVVLASFYRNSVVFLDKVIIF